MALLTRSRRTVIALLVSSFAAGSAVAAAPASAAIGHSGLAAGNGGGVATTHEQATARQVTGRAAGETERVSTPRRPARANGPLISFTFDDGLANQATRALPIMRRARIHGTFFLISDALGRKYYMTVAQAKAVQAGGNEIGSHTVDHPRLTEVSSRKLTAELADSKKALAAKFGPIKSFAYPYGGVNKKVAAEVAKHYSVARTTETGLNARGKYDRYHLKIGYVLHSTTPAEVQKWIDQAKASNSWLILCYHRISDTDPDTYAHSVARFQAEVNAAKRSGVPIVTVRQGFAMTR